MAPVKREDILGFLRAHREELAREFQIRKIGLFGSFARGEGDEESDIDIVVEMENPDLFALARLKERLEEALGKKVDVVRLRKHMNQLLRQRIEDEALYV
uniref:Nucleotidyltransferase n=1 Tax=Candidatus Caldatribacterium saccharofermentans TaxID=1454753 RepID=A0A7V4TII7_9BACT